MEEPVELVIPRPYLAFVRNPFRYVNAHEGFLFGLLFILLSGFIGSLTNTHFDGVLDVHTGATGPLWAFLLPGFMNWVSLAIPLYVAGWALTGRRTSFNDTLGYQAFARTPMVLAVLFTLIPGFQRQAVQPTVFTDDTAVFAVVVLVIVAMVVLMVAWMYRGFTTATRAGSWKTVTAFVIALLIGEIVSKVAFYYLIAPELTLPNLPIPAVV